MTFRKLYHPIKPYSSGFLSVDSLHTLYWEQSGNPDGMPVLLLHGGPGAGATADHRRFFDPRHYRIVIFDQRGCGRSSPPGEVEGNDPAHLVGDIERLRAHLRIGRWIVFGGSWGAALALMYAAAHPGPCAGLILRSVFLMSAPEIRWFLYGARMHFPEVWETFSTHIPQDERADLLEAYWRRLHRPRDAGEAMQAALRWAGYESDCAAFYPEPRPHLSDSMRQAMLAMARIETHYYKNHTLPGSETLLGRIDAFRHVPATIIHGRYDMVTPLATAHDLHRAWPEADYVIVPDGGHAAFDPAMRDRLIAATDAARNMK